jgi:hypothetical protein
VDIDSIIKKEANRTGVSEDWLRKIMKVESGGNPNNITGPYHGLFQLSYDEFKRHGGTGSIYNPETNTFAAANKLAQESRDFKQQYGRDPRLVDLYLVHQQGSGGYAKHMENPDRPAWQNMADTGEGKRKGEAWAKKAIWGNLPDSVKAKYGSVENVSSADFVAEWGHKVGEAGEWTPAPKEGWGSTRTASTDSSDGASQAAKKPAKTFMGEQEEIDLPTFRAPDLVPRFHL